jgi:hypothetical protein
MENNIVTSPKSSPNEERTEWIVIARFPQKNSKVYRELVE